MLYKKHIISLKGKTNFQRQSETYRLFCIVVPTTTQNTEHRTQPSPPATICNGRNLAPLHMIFYSYWITLTMVSQYRISKFRILYEMKYTCIRNEHVLRAVKMYLSASDFVWYRNMFLHGCSSLEKCCWVKSKKNMQFENLHGMRSEWGGWSLCTSQNFWGVYNGDGEVFVGSFDFLYADWNVWKENRRDFF